MNTKIKFFVVVVASAMALVMSGCGLVPDKVSAKIGSVFALPPGYIPYNRIDVFNNIADTYMVLSDRGGTKPDIITTGNFGWVPQNTYFASDGQNYIDNNVITARFYDIKTNEYLGLFHWQVSANSYGYQAFHSPFERKQLER